MGMTASQETAMGSNVERLLEQALGSLTFADINAKRGIKGTTRKHIEDAKKAILRYIEADREEGIEVERVTICNDNGEPKITAWDANGHLDTINPDRAEVFYVRPVDPALHGDSEEAS